MLVKLDQNTAQALQNRDSLLRGTNILDTIAPRGGIGQDQQIRQQQEPQDEVSDQSPYEDKFDDNIETITVTSVNASDNNNYLEPLVTTTDSPSSIISYQSSSNLIPLASSNHNQLYESNAQVSGDIRQEAATTSFDRNSRNSLERAPSATEAARQARKFKLHTSRLKHPAVDRASHRSATSDSKNFRLDKTSENRHRSIESPLKSPEADDIRASINRSLQEYSQLSHNKSTALDYRSDNDDSHHYRRHHRTIYTSHFDDEPNLIHHSPLLDNNYNNDVANGRLHSSPSFSIDVPESNLRGHDDNDSSSNFAHQLLKQSALRKKSTLHLVINRLANQGGQPYAIIGERTKLRLRRAQMRAASYVRRMNYYFRAYPAMKYYALAYIVIMQILVVYVLFFYQSSGGSSAHLSFEKIND